MDNAGSIVVTTLEQAIADIRRRHPEIPEFVTIIGSGLEGRQVKWGHFHANQWSTARGRRHELFVAGETLARPAIQTMTTLLHETVHAWCTERAINDTSRRGQYHNRRFVTAAERFGLVWRNRRPHPTFGFSDVVMSEKAIQVYAPTLAAIEAGSAAWRDLPRPSAGLENGDDDQNDSLHRSRHAKQKAVCACGLTIWAARSTFTRTTISCCSCGAPFAPSGV